MPSPYPTPNEGGARYQVYTREPRDWGKSVLEYEFKDGSASFNRQAPTAPLIVHFEYTDLTPEEEAIHDAHYDSCFGKDLGFEFTDPRSGEVFQNVHYKEYKTNRKTISWRRSRSITLIKRRA